MTLQEQQQELDFGEEPSVFESESGRLFRLRKIRYGLDRTARTAISLGGMGIIVVLLLIFFYLLQEVVPLFQGAEVSARSNFALVGDMQSDTLLMGVEEQTEVGMRLDNNGNFYFFDLGSGNQISRYGIPIPADASVSSFAVDNTESGLMAFGLSNGGLLVLDQEYSVSFSSRDNARIVSPNIDFPLGETLFAPFASDAVVDVAIGSRGEQILVAALNDSGDVVLYRAERQRGLLSAFEPASDQSYTVVEFRLPGIARSANQLLLDGDLRWLLAVNEDGQAQVFDLLLAFQGDSATNVFSVDLVPDGARLRDVRFLLGGVSLLVSSDKGETNQWFFIREEETNKMLPVRNFSGGGNAIRAIAGEMRRKDFITIDSEGVLRIFNTTASRAVHEEQLMQSDVNALAVSPRGDALIVESNDNRIWVWDIDNPHPEISLSALWAQVWYEGYSEPDFIWQSSAASNDFEPKYSLVPLTFGTFKAAFFAMLLAAPLAVCGAIYTGYFMAPRIRRKVKPLVELMEALPTVVLGFLAGLWLAPIVEQNLLAVFTVVFLLPLSILAASLLWMFVPKAYRQSVSEGWEALLLIPVVLVFGWLAFAIAAPLESLFFDGDLRLWLSNDMGVSYDQRNAMVVGLAMGFAVIPTIFSIAEDAIFNVPQQLSYGSLALGATPWQSLYWVVLPTASPGIFSALMIGLGRAVGETMIVLMATGNTPLMDFNMFEGMRTLAANIAVEIPESEVGSSHYRILFLAALVLFAFTFVVNTFAELIRQRLRRRYNLL